MDTTFGARSEKPEVSVIVPARDEEISLAQCLRTLVSQTCPSYEVIVVDDQSADRTREIAESFGVQVIAADPLPSGWSGKSNAAWSGARVAEGRWLLFTDADTKHRRDSVTLGLQEAKDHNAAMLSYSPKQEVHDLAERALMPVIFAELATTFRPKDVNDPTSPAAAANGQYLLIRRDAYDAVNGHAAVAKTILEDVALATLVKSAGYKLRFRQSDVLSTRMYRSFGQMWEGWTKNLALLFPNPRALAAKRLAEFGLIVGSASIAFVEWRLGRRGGFGLAALIALASWSAFLRRIRRAHFDSASNLLAVMGLPLFSLLLLNSDISHRGGTVTWKGRQYGRAAQLTDGEVHGTSEVIDANQPVLTARTIPNPHHTDDLI
jgi:cellulose synthase/poly-beta-1,6-N-acetylglucosamine synthase-like glycosyltransferase